MEQNGIKMAAPSEAKEDTHRPERGINRNLTEIAVECSPFTSRRNGPPSGGIMRNYSSHGSYIESYQSFLPGTILLVRIVQLPLPESGVNGEEGFRFISLAEVKWRQHLKNEPVNRYGMGLKYF